mmetsp:Transcript_15207/g.61133  ORF Transcript_15207/g.61133 Transcript_15207/m.61133 type:complete len:200 (+) Transcript_15207:448-1047(+)
MPVDRRRSHRRAERGGRRGGGERRTCCGRRCRGCCWRRGAAGDGDGGRRRGRRRRRPGGPGLLGVCVGRGRFEVRSIMRGAETPSSSSMRHPLLAGLPPPRCVPCVHHSREHRAVTYSLRPDFGHADDDTHAAIIHRGDGAARQRCEKRARCREEGTTGGGTRIAHPSGERSKMKKKKKNRSICRAKTKHRVDDVAVAN